MRTLRLSIAAQQAQGYPLRLYCQDGRPDWNTAPLADTYIPADFYQMLPPPGHAVGETLTLSAACELLLTQADDSGGYKAVGKYLFQLLNRDNVSTQWQEFYAKTPQEGVRTVLDIEPEELRGLPWEMLRKGPEFLYPNAAKTLIRGPIDWTVMPDSDPWPLRVLVVIGCKESDETIQAEQERVAIEQAFRSVGKRIDVEFCIRKSPRELNTVLQEFQPHVFHFIGHGRKKAGGDGAVLLLYDEAGKDEIDWDVETILTYDRVWTPRFVFLNCCRSGDSMKQPDSYALSDAFYELGALGVVAMRGDIDGAAAATLGEVFYRELMKGVPVDAALGKARQQVSTASNLDRHDWALPTLRLRVPPECVVPIQSTDYDVACPQCAQSAEFGKIQGFVNRRTLRRDIWRSVDPQMFAYISRRLLVLTGVDKVGKTALAHWCLEACAYRGYNLHYVCISKETEGERNYIEVLRRMRDGDGISKPPLAGLPAEAFREFNWELNRRLRDEEPTWIPMPDGDIIDDRLPWKDGLPEGTAEKLCQAFGRALTKAAELKGNKPLLLALDQMVIRSEQFKLYLLPELIKPILQDKASPIRLILVVTNSQFDDFNLASVKSLAECDVKSVERFPFKEAASLLLEFSRYHWHLIEDQIEDKVQKDETQKTINNIINAYAGIIKEAWLPEVHFGFVESLVKGARNG